MIAVIIPTLNEEEAIADVIEGFPEKVGHHSLETYVIDGGSTDDTLENAKNAGAEVIRQRLKGGKGNGVKQALREIDADIYVMIDGDGTYDPGQVERVVRPILDGEAEHVIGRRSDRTEGAIPRLNLFGNYVFNLAVRLSTGEDIHDMLSGYRAFTDFSLDYTEFTKPGFGIETEITFTALENHVPIEEVEISYEEREGESKLHPISDGWRIVNTIIWSIRDMNPLKFFSSVSLVFFLAAVYPSYLTFSQYFEHGRIVDVAPGLAASVFIIVGLQLFILGMLSDQIKDTEKRLRSRLTG
jgi:glycosyltransferase involved in cell wall biosynthesis